MRLVFAFHLNEPNAAAHECISLFIQYFWSILNNSRIALIADRLKQLFIRTDFIVNMDISFLYCDQNCHKWPLKIKKTKIKQIETKNAVIWNDTMNLKIITVFVYYFDWMELKLNCLHTTHSLIYCITSKYRENKKIKMIRAHDAPYFMNNSLWKYTFQFVYDIDSMNFFLWQFKSTIRAHFRHVFGITPSWLRWWAENWT